MYHLIIDTCVWINLCREFPKVLDKVESLVEQKKVRLILPSIIIEEWKRHKPKLLEQRERSVRGMITTARELSQYFDPTTAGIFKEILDKFQKQKDTIENIASVGINHIKQLFDHPATIVLETTDTAKIQAGDLALAKKAPFGSKNSMADALIILTAAEYIAKEGLTNCIFVSSNSKDFSSSSKIDEVHEDLKDLFHKHRIGYFINIGLAINEVEANLVSEQSIEQVEEKVILDALYDTLRTIDEATILPIWESIQAASETMAVPIRVIQAASEVMAVPIRVIQAASEAMAVPIRVIQAASEAMAVPMRILEAMQRVAEGDRKLMEAIIAAMRPLRITAASETQKDDATPPDDAQGDKPKKSDVT